MTSLIAFETERLRLRRWHEADLQPFAALNADPQVMVHFPQALTRAACDALAQRIRTEIVQHGWGLWAVEVKHGTPFIGFVGLHVPTADLPCVPCVEIGWRLAVAHWGQGYAAEAARGVLNVAFERIGLDEMVSFTARNNRRSLRVMQCIGMGYSGTFKHPDLPVGHALREHVLYRMQRQCQEVSA